MCFFTRCVLTCRVLFSCTFVFGMNHLLDDKSQLSESSTIYITYDAGLNKTHENRNEFITAHAGQNISFHCSVDTSGKQLISWIRKRDLHILSVGDFLFSNNERMQSYQSQTGTWKLELYWLSINDSGEYECQSNSFPKTSVIFTLTVLDSRAVILGYAEVYSRSGNNLNLTCVIQNVLYLNESIQWFHNDNSLQNSSRGGVFITTNKQRKISQLLIYNISTRDGGYYKCQISIARPAMVEVHVIEEGIPEAMQSQGNSKARQKSVEFLIVFILFMDKLRKKL